MMKNRFVPSEKKEKNDHNYEKTAVRDFQCHFVSIQIFFHSVQVVEYVLLQVQSNHAPDLLHSFPF